MFKQMSMGLDSNIPFYSKNNNEEKISNIMSFKGQDTTTQIKLHDVLFQRHIDLRDSYFLRIDLDEGVCWPVKEDDIGLTNVSIRERNIKQFIGSKYFDGKILFTREEHLKFNLTSKGRDVEITDENSEFIVNMS